MDWGWAKPSKTPARLGGLEGVLAMDAGREGAEAAVVVDAVMERARARDIMLLLEEGVSGREYKDEGGRSALSAPGTPAFLRGAEPEVSLALARRSLAASIPFGLSSCELSCSSSRGAAIWRV